MVRPGPAVFENLDLIGLVVDVADSVDISKLTPGKRVTLLSDTYRLEKMLPSSVSWPVVSVVGVRLTRY